jgi:SAM-dependent methyltransferase
VQTEDYSRSDELFTRDYAYFSSVSQGWLDHAAAFSKQIAESLGLDKDSFVIEVASNDGYLLRNFVEAGIPCLGIEPTDSTADAAEALGIPVAREFFGRSLADRLTIEGRQADLIVGNNVYAHVPDINDFTEGLKIALKPGGTISLEFPHLLMLVQQNQFDTVYHEHYSYLSLQTVKRVFEVAGLRVFDVEELPTHGGSLRVFGCHLDDVRASTSRVEKVLGKELSAGLQNLETYLSFQHKADKVKNDLLSFLIDQARNGKKVAAYGAAAKGNTLLNYAGVKPDLVEFVCDAAPSKQGKYLPGSHIPVLVPNEINQRKPDYVLVLPWNIASEVISANESIREWGGCFVKAVPKLEVL